MQEVDLTNCDKEPIHLINKIQLHGCMLIVDPISQKIIGYSDNFQKFIGHSSRSPLGKKLNTYFPARICQEVYAVSTNTSIFREVTLNDQVFLVIFHNNGEQIIIEIELRDDSINIIEQQMQLSKIFAELNIAEDVAEMCASAAGLIKRFTHYDRVMIYQFDEHWNGKVVAESKEEALESWLGLNYPASDIPKQARALFLSQGVRMVSDVNGSSIPVHIAVQREVDFTKSELRAVSPIHIQYLQNMKVGATLTAAIVYNGELWGLIACHHYQKRCIDYYTRSSVKFLTQVFSTQLGLRSTNLNLEKTNRSNRTRARLLEKLSANWNITKALENNGEDFMKLTEATGAVVYFDGNLIVSGSTPDKDQIIKLLHSIKQSSAEDIFLTDNLEKRLQVTDLTNDIVGVLCIFMSTEQKDALLWFKEEITKRVTWAGNPKKSVVDENGTLSPRKSFEKWKQIQKGYSKPWKPYEIASAKAMREHISEIILHKYEEMLELNDRLKAVNKELESFSYSVSHDLRAPLRGISGFSQILSEQYFDVLDDFGKDALETIGRSTKKMNTLIDDILSFSGLGKKDAQLSEFNMNNLVEEVLDYLNPKEVYGNTDIVVQQELGMVTGDRAMIFQLLSNLISNALKYSAKAPRPLITIGKKSGNFFVKDNGIGFDMKHIEQIFGVFKRLVNDDYEGSGIGLAIAKRVVEKHSGKLWAESIPDGETTFYFKLNKSN